MASGPKFDSNLALYKSLLEASFMACEHLSSFYSFVVSRFSVLFFVVYDLSGRHTFPSVSLFVCVFVLLFLI